MEAQRYAIQNIRRPWKPLERADSILRIKSELRLSNQELAGYLGVSESFANEYLELRNQQLRFLRRFVEYNLNSSFTTELSRLKPRICKIAGLEPDEIMDNLLARITAGTITSSKEIRVIKRAFIRVSLNEDALTEYFQNNNMRVKDLESHIVTSGFAADVQKLIDSINKRLQDNQDLTTEETVGLKQLAGLVASRLKMS